jgi:hypothetical protein
MSKSPAIGKYCFSGYMVFKLSSPSNQAKSIDVVCTTVMSTPGERETVSDNEERERERIGERGTERRRERSSAVVGRGVYGVYRRARESQ